MHATCEETGKRCYRSPRHARKANKRNCLRLRNYRCEHCGKWHVTKQTENEAPRMQYTRKGRTMREVLAAIAACLSLATIARADEFPQPSVIDPAHVLRIPVELRQWYRNPDGSCVQCSNGMCGVEMNVPAFSTLLWDTEYGPRVRGGSWPGRVADYAKARGVRIYNVTGDNTWDWMRWACATGRPCAIGAGGSHFQTLAGYDPQTQRWFVCNNNSPQRIDEYSEEGFRRLHLASGQWCVILDYPPTAANPEYRKWW